MGAWVVADETTSELTDRILGDDFEIAALVGQWIVNCFPATKSNLWVFLRDGLCFIKIIVLQILVWFYRMENNCKINQMCS